MVDLLNENFFFPKPVSPKGPGRLPPFHRAVVQGDFPKPRT